MHLAMVHDVAMHLEQTELIGSAEACALLDVDRSTLVRLIHAGKLQPRAKMPGANGAYVFDPSAIEALAAERRAASETDR